jgi:DNA-binding NarL/FixJ family response regulator
MFKKRITVLLAEDHMVVREGIRKLLELDDDLEVVAEAKDGRQAVALVQKLRPSVVVMDIAMALLNGLEATRQILKAVPGAKIIILSSHNDDAYINGATASGAMGFLLKYASIHDLSDAIREVNRGKVFFGPFMAKLLPKSQRELLNRSRLSKPRQAGLVAREMEVLQLIAEGNTSKEIALDLGICQKTVEKHRETLMLKLDIHDIAGLTRYAISVGIIESSVQLTVVQP